MNLDPDFFASIIDQFRIKGSIERFIPFGSGHINDTFRLINSHSEHPDYLLQRINHHVFPDISGMMGNINSVISHLNKNCTESESVPRLIATQENTYFLVDDLGNFWRIYDFKKDTRSYDIVKTPEQAYKGGLAYGNFLFQMSDFDVSRLCKPIPDFHNIISRLDQLDRARGNAVKERSQRTSELLLNVFELADEMCRIEDLRKEGKIPERVTHNDTKFNNLLFDQNDRPLCVIDLDTVMPGLVHYDFGDGVRSAANNSAEDEKDLHKVQFDIEKFAAFTQGYLQGSKRILSSIELTYLARAAAVIPYTMSVRFLTDFLAGDIYYKISYEDQNYNRAVCQMELAKQIHSRELELNDIIAKEAKL